MPTIVNGGFRSNVLPGSAEATVNIRLLPGARPRPAIRELKRVIGDKRVVVTPIGTTGETATQTLDRFDERAKQLAASTDSDLHRAHAREGKPSGRPPARSRRCSRPAPTPSRGARRASPSTASTRTRSRAPSWRTCTATTSTSRSAASRREPTCSRA
jgi:hypothetical protein